MTISLRLLTLLPHPACLSRSFCLCAADEGGLGTQKTPVHLLQLRTIPVALLTLELLPGITTDTRELFDVFGQLGQLIGLEQGKYSDPPAAELLMRKLAAALPAAMQSWKVKVCPGGLAHRCGVLVGTARGGDASCT